MDFDTFINDLENILCILNEGLDQISNNLAKEECCKCLDFIGENLKNLDYNKYFNKELVTSLKVLTKDKTQTLSSAANKALKQWLEIQKIVENQSKNAFEKYSEKKRNCRSMGKFNLISGIDKLNKCATPELAREEIYSKGIQII